MLVWTRLFDEAFGFMPDGALEPIRRDLHLGYSGATAMLVAPFVTSLAALWVTARADRGDPRRVVVGGAWISALAMVCFAASPGLVGLTLAGGLWGFGASLLVHGGEIALARHVGDQLHRTLRWSNLAGTAGDVIGPLLLAGILALGWSWRIAFVAGGVAIAGYATVLLGLPSSAPAPPASGETEDATVTGSTAWRDPGAWRLGLLAFLLMPFDETWLAFVIAFLQTRHGVSAGAATLFGIVAVLGAFAGAGPIARRAEFAPQRRVLLVCAVALALSGGTVARLPIAGIAIAGFVVNGAITSAWVTLQHATLTLRPGEPGRTMAVVAGIEHTTFVVPLVLGWVADRVGIGAVFAVYLALAGLLAAAAVAGGGAATPPASNPPGAQP